MTVHGYFCRVQQNMGVFYSFQYNRIFLETSADI